MELPRGHTPLSEDERPIKAIYWPGEGAGGFTAGEYGCTKIVAYDENGSMSHVPWIAVFKGDEIAVRLPADQVSVHYATAADNANF